MDGRHLRVGWAMGGGEHLRESVWMMEFWNDGLMDSWSGIVECWNGSMFCHHSNISPTLN